MPKFLHCRVALSLQLHVATVAFEGTQLLAGGDYARCPFVCSVGQMQFVSSASYMLSDGYFLVTGQDHQVPHLPTAVGLPADLYLP